ncbi:MAG: hypothetical protein GAK43_00739 [Stenotrophomonas maltophilia]|nr:MAG: hypothetical protein GAK43_00739 [Stenotrophomonas maltophilia]
MNLWWAILLLALVLSPLTWLVPSRKQRGQMDLRLQARRLGLAMQMAKQDWPHWLERQPPRSCAQYHCPRRRGRVDAWVYWQSEPGVWLDRWREACADPTLLEALRGLPGDVFQVEATAQYLALYWGERGDASALQRVADFMQQQA